MFESVVTTSPCRMKLVCLYLMTMTACILASSCKLGQERCGGFCYQLLDQKMAWDEANTTCSDMGGGLVVPNSEDEHQFIWKMFERNIREGNVWIGCTDMEEEGKWIQAGGGGQECSYFNWAQGQPNQYNGWEEDCVEMRNWYDGLWNDSECFHMYFVICRFTACHPEPDMFCLLADDNGHFTAK